jgi:cell division protein FtsW (lipid II flippase)
MGTQFQSFISSINPLGYASMAIRLILPVLAVLIVLRCGSSLLKRKAPPEQWGALGLPNGGRISLTHWENVIGRAKSSDIYLEYPTLSRTHAALIRNDSGGWRLYDIRPFTRLGKGGWFWRRGAAPLTPVMVNGQEVEGKGGVIVRDGDIINLGGVELAFLPREYDEMPSYRTERPVKRHRAPLLLLTQFQALLGVQLSIASGVELTLAVPLSMLLLTAIMWLSYAFSRRGSGFGTETLAFFLCSIGLAVTISAANVGIIKQMAFLLAGVVFFFAMGWFLRDLNTAKKMRLPVAVIGVVMLASTLVLGSVIGGARRWLEIGGFSFQPSEFVKIAFILVGASTLDRLFAKRNLLVFIGFAGVCVLILAITNDFGSALVFFVAYLVIAFMRSGDFTTIFLSVGGAVFAGFLAGNFRPHLGRRFEAWGSVWEHAQTGGFQQTRAMSAAAGGGLFGTGAGEGWFKRIFAADNDLVFALVCEELGLIVAMAAVAALILPVFYALRSAGSAKSSFYAICACAAASVLVFQMSLNVLGTVDIFPFTGITFPFVSRGGSSLVASWGLLALIKSGDSG